MISYFEKQGDKWLFKDVHVNGNEKRYNKKKGRVKKDFSISKNNEITYIGKDNKKYILKTPKKAKPLNYEHDSYINGLR